MERSYLLAVDQQTPLSVLLLTNALVQTSNVCTIFVTTVCQNSNAF
jgi:hypothetical protein